jgi:phospholipase/carboxylesterase
MKADTRLVTFENWTIRLRPPRVKPARVMLMLHGWTGDEDSMWIFADGFPPDYWIIAPRAPYAAPQGGYSWRTLPVPDQIRDWAGIEDLRPSARALADFIERWAIANSVETQQVDAMGFSQGAAMAIAFSVLYPQRVRKLAVLSGFAPREADRFVVEKPLAGKQVFVAHGTQDEMVPAEFARGTINLLERLGARVTYCEADVGHKVSNECRRALAEFFSSDKSVDAALDD